MRASDCDASRSGSRSRGSVCVARTPPADQHSSRSRGRQAGLTAGFMHGAIRPRDVRRGPGSRRPDGNSTEPDDGTLENNGVASHCICIVSHTLPPTTLATRACGRRAPVLASSPGLLIISAGTVCMVGRTAPELIWLVGHPGGARGSEPSRSSLITTALLLARASFVCVAARGVGALVANVLPVARLIQTPTDGRRPASFRLDLEYLFDWPHLA